MHIITFRFLFSSCLYIKFSPISLFLLEVSCSYISSVGLIHDVGQATCTQWCAESAFFFKVPLGGRNKRECLNDLVYFSQHTFKKKKTLLIISVNLFEIFWKGLLHSRKSPC